MARRGNGEGSIYKRHDGRWAGVLHLGYAGVRRRRKTFYGKTRHEVVARLAAARRGLEQGLPIPPDRLTLAKYLQQWLEDSARPSVKAATYEGYERMVRLHIVPELGRLRLARLSPQALSGLYRRLLNKGLAPKTVALVHAMLHRALFQAVRWGLVAVNVSDAADPPRPVRKEFRTLTVTEAERLMRAARGDRFHGLYVLALATGLRQAELLGLRWSDIDFGGAVLAVRQQVYRVNGRWLYSEPKTTKGRRTVALPAFAVEALRGHRVRQTHERLVLGGAWEDGGLVFSNRRGRPMEKQNLLRRSFWPILERAGLPRIRFHDLRHTAASLLLAQGTHPKVVQERLGPLDYHRYHGHLLARNANTPERGRG